MKSLGAYNKIKLDREYNTSGTSPSNWFLLNTLAIRLEKVVFRKTYIQKFYLNQRR